MKRKIAAIVAADVAGYSRLVAEDEEETIRRLAAYREVYDDFIKQYGGRIFNTAGDAVLSEFESAVEAVRAAIDIQESLRTRDLAFPPSRKLQFRIGISIGDVIERNGDLLGDGVNIAARLEGLAEPGGVCVSRSVHEAVANKISVPFRYLGERQVKNIPQPIAAFVVAFPGSDEPNAPGSATQTSPRAWRPWLIGAAALALVLLALVVARPYLSTMNRERRIASSTTPSESQASKPTASDAGKDVVHPTGPRSAPDLYREARLLESQGNTIGARQAYDAIERLGLDLIDPALRYAALLRVQEGRAAAREVFADLERDKPARVTALLHALQFDGAEQQARVSALAAHHPDFAPAQYWLGEQFSDDRLGRAPTLAERAMARNAFERFLKADADGRLTPYFLDLSVLATWLDRARARQRELSAIAQTGGDKPTAQFMRSNDGWTATVMLPEPALAMSYRIGDAGAYRASGDGAATDPRTGHLFPNPNIALAPDQGLTTISIRYTDAAGRVAEPASIPVDPRGALVATQRQALELTSNSWLAFRRDMDSLLYFTQLVSYRCAISKAVIGLDDAPVDRVLTLPPCDERNPYEIPSTVTPYLTIPKTTRSVSVRLTYADGTESDIKTIRR